MSLVQNYFNQIFCSSPSVSVMKYSAVQNVKATSHSLPFKMLTLTKIAHFLYLSLESQCVVILCWCSVSIRIILEYDKLPSTPIKC